MNVKNTYRYVSSRIFLVVFTVIPNLFWRFYGAYLRIKWTTPLPSMLLGRASAGSDVKSALLFTLKTFIL